MRFVIKHEINGRLRVHVKQTRMSYEEADTLQYYLQEQQAVTSVKVNHRTQDVVIFYVGEREAIIRLLRSFSYERVEVPQTYLQNSGRELNDRYWEKLVMKLICRALRKLVVPYPIRYCFITLKSAGYIWKGLKTLMRGRIEVPVLDAAAIGVSVVRRDMPTASSIMFLLGIGELLEEWTHKKSVTDLARSMSLNIEKVWLVREGQEILVPVTEICEQDFVMVHMGNVIPFDGVVVEGEAMINQTSMTGEGLPVHKKEGAYVYAGTVIEEGELTIQVREINGSSRYQKIVMMIEESEKLKSALESKAEHLADKLVPYTLGGAGFLWLLTRNVTKALAVLMVDFSCALKLAMPISVLSAIREASRYSITVKGGKYLEAVAEADTIVFDKTGTLTMAQPTVVKVIPFCDKTEDELLRIAACMEEHFPHSVAKAVVDAARKRNLVHEEMHTKVEYIVAHGIATMIDGHRAVIGSYHFVMEDEECTIPQERQKLFGTLPPEYSHLYLAIENELVAVICIEDPLREEAGEVIRMLRETGISKVVMMTGD
ncbi:MAG: HAD-IC family P-type ATPase, partial [Lachnospiraceae bacterium]|nr:HAD-IC family P-type ATPase [Lachnospiraceae bacterium]